MGSTSAQRGNLAMSISSSGNVGIGVASPSNKLEVQQLASDQSGAAAIKVIGTAYGTNKTIHACMGTTSNTKSLFYAENSNGVIMNIAGDGNVGIGTANPSEKLHVNGLTQLGAAGKTEGGAIITYASFSEIKNAAATLIGNAVVPGTANNTIQHSKTDAGNYIKLKYNQGITFHTNITNSIDTDISEDTNESVRIDLNGNVGIGTTNPTHSLNVVGGIKTDQIYDKNNVSGSDGQILSSTTTGIDWVDVTEIEGVVSGSGTATYLPLWTDTNTLSSSIVFQQADGNVGVNTTTPAYELEVSGGFAATEKHFVVQDPTNPKKRLVHSSLEGPENAVYFRGISNKKVIELPEYWRWLVNSDTITVHLTPVKKYQKLYFSKYEDNKIYINNSLVDKLKFNKLNYHYIIYAERKDVNKLKVYVTK
jgi:hypothetical protein